LKQALRVYLEHRLVVVRRRSEFDLARAKARAHILEGLLIALQFLDEVISIIRGSPDAEQAKQRLIKRFKLSELQAQAILDMQLRRLASLERKKIEQEHKELTQQIKDLEALLKSPKKMRQAVDDELAVMKLTYADRRRTLIMRLKEGARTSSFLTTTDITPAQEVWVAVTSDGCISRTLDDQMPSVEGREAPRWLLHTNTHHTLYLVSETGKAAAIPVHSVPEAGTLAEGVAVAKVSPLADDEALAGMFALPPRVEGEAPQYVLTLTQAGLVKKSQVDELPGPSAHAFILTRVNDGDRLTAMQITDGTADLLLATTRGMAIRFNEADIRPMGLVAAGVGGIKLSGEDTVIAGELLFKDSQAFLVTSSGRTKRVPAKDFPVQGRYGQGVTVWKLPKDVQLAGMVVGKPGLYLLVHFQNGLVRKIRLEQAAFSNRAGQGTALAWLKADERVLSVTRLPAEAAEITETSPAPKKRLAPAVKVVDHTDGKISSNGKVSTPVKASKVTHQPNGRGTLTATQLPLLGEEVKERTRRISAPKPPSMAKPSQKLESKAKTVGANKPPRKESGAAAIPAKEPPISVKPAKKAPEKPTRKSAEGKKSTTKAAVKPASGKKTPTKTATKPPAAKKPTVPAAGKSVPAKPTEKK
jgi:DNA gyrase subunit A